MRHWCLLTCRRLLSTNGRNTSVMEQKNRITSSLNEALESTSYIAESAQQAYLETEPSRRSLPEDYKIRYMDYACNDIENAISQYDQLASEIGTQKIKELEIADKKFGLAVADSLLARDRLRASIQDSARKVKEMKDGGLKKEDLTFCGP